MLLFKFLFSKKISNYNGLLIREISSKKYIISHKDSDLYHHVKMDFKNTIFLFSITVYKGLLLKPIYTFTTEKNSFIPEVFLPYSFISIVKDISNKDIFKVLNSKNIYKILENINRNLFQIDFDLKHKNFSVFSNKNSYDFLLTRFLDIEKYGNMLNNYNLNNKILYYSDIFDILKFNDVVINSYPHFRNFYILGKNENEYILFLKNKIIKSSSLEDLSDKVENSLLKNVEFVKNLKNKMLSQNIIKDNEKITKEHLKMFRLLNY